MRQKHLPPNSNLFSDFGHFVLKILEILKMVYIQRFSFKITRFLEGRPPPEFRTGEGGREVPSVSPSPGGDAHVL